MSGAVAVEALQLALGAFRLRSVSFSVSGGEILVILGPNGAGKSVILETIAGFHRPDSGRVLIGGRDVTGLPPEQRKVGFVVQNFGLFPHLTVAQNVAIGWRPDLANCPTTRLPCKPAKLLEYFGIAYLARRFPADLSPGEKQRTALARAICAAPDLFLFDEPFSALDAQTRVQLRDELKSFLRALAIPAIFVTHAHDEALALADTIVVLRDGGLVQCGPARHIFHSPVNSFVAHFVGVENILEGRIVDQPGGMTAIEVGKQILHVAAERLPTVGAKVRLGIRAEEVTLAPSTHALPETNRLDGIIVALLERGPISIVEVDCGFKLNACLLAPQTRAMKLGVGKRIIATIAADAIQLMND